MKKKLLALVLATSMLDVQAQVVVGADCCPQPRPACCPATPCQRVCRPRRRVCCPRPAACRPRPVRPCCERVCGPRRGRCAPCAPACGPVCRPKRVCCPRIRCCRPKPVCCPPRVPPCPAPACIEPVCPVGGPVEEVVEPGYQVEAVVGERPARRVRSGRRVREREYPVGRRSVRRQSRQEVQDVEEEGMPAPVVGEPLEEIVHDVNEPIRRRNTVDMSQAEPEVMEDLELEESYK